MNFGSGIKYRNFVSDANIILAVIAPVTNNKRAITESQRKWKWK